MKLLIFRSIVFCAAFLMWNTLASQIPSSSNILLITIDTIRPDALSCYGGKTKTPELDQIAERGILYENAFSPVPLTLPSHVSILTGFYPSRHGIHHNGMQVFRDSSITLPYLLRLSGYRTGAVVSSYVLDRKFGLAEDFDFYDDAMIRNSGDIVENEAERTADQTFQSTTALLSKLAGKKWFVWIHFFDPHVPYSPPSPLKGYQGEVLMVDSYIGQLKKWLKQKALDQNLILAVAGDHGESLGEHGEATHGFFTYNATLKVPMLISSPGNKPARVAAPVSVVDLAPTLLALAGVKDTISRDGRSLIGNIGTRALYFESLYPQLHGWNSLQGLIRNEWKFIFTTRPELYNLRVDPQEKNNLYAKENVISAQMSRELITFTKAAASKPVESIDAETREKLESLGYVSSNKVVRGTADPKDRIRIWARYQDFLKLKNSGDHSRALPVLKEIVKEEPANPFFQIQLAREYRIAGNATDAVLLLKKIAAAGSDEEAYYELALAYQQLKNYPEAIRSIHAAIAIRPDRSELHDIAGILHAQTGKLDAAISEFRNGLALDPNNPSLWHNLANALRDSGLPNEAAAAYLKAIERMPGYASAWNGLGTVRFQQGNIQEAIRCLLKAREIDSSLHEVYFNLGIAYQAAGKSDEARTYYKTFLKLAPQSMREQRDAAKQQLLELD